jgi:hypothetical protein
MSHYDVTCALLTGVVAAGTLAAQPDPVYECRKRVAMHVNAPQNGVIAARRGAFPNGNYAIWWDAQLANGGMVKGFCEASSQTGQVVRFGTGQDKTALERTYRLTPEDAERICRREARARFDPGNGEIVGIFLDGISTKNTYRVQWRYDRTSRTIRTGRCDIDSYTGFIRKFRANDGW